MYTFNRFWVYSLCHNPDLLLTDVYMKPLYVWLNYVTG